MITGLYKTFEHWAAKGAIWIYSDTHFGDVELQSSISNRPTDEEQVKLINSKVGKNDTLILLGDVGDVSYVRQLKGYKVLLCGNHDAGVSNYTRKKHVFRLSADEYNMKSAIAAIKAEAPWRTVTAVLEYDITRPPFKFWTVTADNKLFDEVYEGPLMIGERLLLSHEPIEQNYALNIHGHVHDLHHKDDTYHLNVCADAINYTPICLNHLIKSGRMANISSIHRKTIDKATDRKRKRNG